VTAEAHAGIGEWLTRATVWLALWLYAGSEGVQAARGRFFTASRWLNTFGCLVFVAHVACAFHYYHQWSHAAAYADTARQTAAWFGRNWGGGLYLNYLFTLIWLGDAVWSWAFPKSYLGRHKGVAIARRAVFFFMIVNGAVVFARTEIRWLGIVLCLILTACWVPRRTNAQV
jgi:hypothetical protein